MMHLKKTIITWYNIIKEQFPIIFMETMGFLTYLMLRLLILYAHVLVLAVLVLQLVAMLLLTIGCLPLLILSWVHSNLTYSGEKTHQDFASNIGKPVVAKLRKVAEKFGYTFSIYKTKSILHGLGQVRNRTFYFFWKGDKVPKFEFIKRKEHERKLMRPLDQ